MKLTDRLAEMAEKSALSAKSIIKLALQSKKCTVRETALPDDVLVVMGNGPSLAKTIADEGERLGKHRLMAVNFAVKSPSFFELKPEFYTMIDPAFFHIGEDNPEVEKLWNAVRDKVDWDITFFVPAKARIPVDLSGNPHVRVERINPVGVEGFEWLENMAYSSGRGMPRPRNVLIASLMAGLKLGFKKIHVVGADHTWTQNLEVNDRNELIAVEKHFYEEANSEHERRLSIYRNVRMHQMMYSLYVAFSSYFAIERFARRKGVEIINSTPFSFIDAFRRGPLPD